jgi:hypothetical protein
MNAAQDPCLIGNGTKGERHVFLARIGILKTVHDELAKLGWQFTGCDKLDWHWEMLFTVRERSVPAVCLD